MHRARMARHGSTDARRGNIGTLAERYERFVVRRDGCWAWDGVTNDRGYGQVDKRYAHRVAYELFIGPIPDGLNVLHRCDNPPCSNPEHLFVGTQADNVADAKAKGRLRGAPRRFTDAQIAEMTRLRTLRVPSVVIAEQFGTGRCYVNYLVKREALA